MSKSREAFFRHALHYADILDQANDLYLQEDKKGEGINLLDNEWQNIHLGNIWTKLSENMDYETVLLRNIYLTSGEGLVRLRLHSSDLKNWRDITQEGTQNQKLLTAFLQHAKHFAQVMQSAEALFVKGGEALKYGLELFDTAWENIKLGQSWLAKNMFKSDRIAFICTTYPDNAAYLLDLRQPAREQIQWRKDALTAAQQIGWRMVEGIHLGSIGNGYYAQGNLDEALGYYTQYLEIARETKDIHSEGLALGNLGNIYRNLGSFERALNCYKQFLEITHQLDDRRGQGNAFGSLAVLYQKMGDYKKSINYSEQSLDIFKEIGDRVGESAACCNLGNTYNILENYQEAIINYTRALEIDIEIGDDRGRGFVLWQLGLVLKSIGKRNRAITCLQAALRIFEDMEDPRKDDIQNFLSNME